MNIGDTIREHRVKKDLKAHVIYDKLGVSQSTYSKMENNKYKMDIKTLKDIASALEIDIVKLIGEDKIAINHTNSDNGSGGSGIVVTNNHSDKLIESLENQILLLKEQNEMFRDAIKIQKEEISILKE